MNMKFFLGILFVIGLSFSTVAQSEGECHLLRKASPKMTGLDREELDQLMVEILDKIEPCMELDSLDRQIFSPTVLKVHLIHLTNEYNNLTYGILIDYLKENLSSPAYLEGKAGYQALLDLKDKKIEVSDSLHFAESLQRIGFRKGEIEELTKLAYDPNHDQNTYGEILGNYIEQFQTKEPKPEKAETDTKLFNHFETLKNKKQLTSASSNRNILLYFSEFGTAENRKFEDKLLLDGEIQVLLKAYENYVAFLDYKENLSDELKADFPDKDLKTTADYMQALKDTYAPGLEAPLLIVLDQDLQLKGIYASGLNKEKLRNFLKQYQS